MPTTKQIAFFNALVRQNEHDALIALDEIEDVNFLIKLKQGFLLNCIHLVAQHGMINVLNKMIEKGADLTLQDGSGQTALHHAQGKGHQALINRLFECQPQLCIVRNTQGITPFHLAVAQDDVGSLKRYLQFKADLNNVRDNNGDSLLHWAAKHNNAKIAKLLVQYGARATALNNQNFKPSVRCPIIGADPELVSFLKTKENSLFERCAQVLDTMPEEKALLPALLLQQQTEAVTFYHNTKKQKVNNQVQLEKQFLQMQTALTGIANKNMC